MLDYCALERVPDNAILDNLYETVCNQFDLKRRQGGIVVPYSDLGNKFPNTYSAHVGVDSFSQAQHFRCFAYAMEDEMADFVWRVNTSSLLRTIGYIYEA